LPIIHQSNFQQPQHQQRLLLIFYFSSLDFTPLIQARDQQIYQKSFRVDKINKSQRQAHESISHQPQAQRSHRS